MDKYKDNFDDDNKMEEYKFDPNDYCRLCDGHLFGIRHLVECRRKREKEFENDTEIANNELPRRPLELGVSEEEKNHETLAEKVSKLENEEGEINAIVKEIEKAEKIYTHDMELIRQVLERQVLSPQDRLTLNKVLEQSETMMERINQAKDFIKKRNSQK